MLRRSGRCALVLGWVSVIYWLTIAIATHLPSGLAVGGPRGSDKMAHFVAYGLLAFLLAWTISARRRLSTFTYAGLLMACLAYALVDELAQIPIPGRVADVWDVLADAVGAVLGLSAHRVWQHVIEHFAFRRLAHLQQLRRLPR
jgi:hypothetical protein